MLTHEKHTIPEIAARLRELSDERKALTAAHGTLPAQTVNDREARAMRSIYEPAPGQPAPIDMSRELRANASEIAALEYELECARHMVAAGLTPGARVTVRAPFMGRDATGAEILGSDALTGREGTVRRMSSDGADVLLDFNPNNPNDGGWAPTPRIVKIET